MTDTQRWGKSANLLKMLGHPVRLALIEELSKAPKCVTDIQDLLDVRQANVSQHLAVLREAEIVADRIGAVLASAGRDGLGPASSDLESWRAEKARALRLWPDSD